VLHDDFGFNAVSPSFAPVDLSSKDKGADVTAASSTKCDEKVRDVKPHLSKVERRREQNREAQRRFRQRARTDAEHGKDSNIAPPTNTDMNDASAPFLGKRMRDGPSSMSIAAPKLAEKDAGVQQTDNSVLDMVLKQLAAQSKSVQGTTSVTSSQNVCVPPVGAMTASTPMIGCDLGQQVAQILKMGCGDPSFPPQKSSINVLAPARTQPQNFSGQTPTQFDNPSTFPAPQPEIQQTDQERNLKKLRRRAQNREAQRRHRLRMRQGGSNAGENDDDNDDSSIPKQAESPMPKVLNNVPAPVDTKGFPPVETKGFGACHGSTSDLLQMLFKASMPASVAPQTQAPSALTSGPLAGLSV